MRKIICPICKSDSGFSKDKHCSSGWRCPICNVCCIVEKRIKKNKKIKYNEPKED